LNLLKEDEIIVKSHSYCDTAYTLEFPNSRLLRSAGTGRFESNPDSFYHKLKNLNLINNKHIPQVYLRASIEQRMELLRGVNGYRWVLTVKMVGVNFVLLIYN